MGTHKMPGAITATTALTLHTLLSASTLAQASSLAEKWQILTKKAFGDILEEANDNSFFENDFPAHIIKGNSGNLAVPKPEAFKYNDIFPESVIMKKPSQDAKIKLIENIFQSQQQTLEPKIIEPKLTWYGIQMVDKNIVENLVKHGHPFGGPKVQTRSSWGTRSGGWRPERRKISPAWF